MSDVTQEEVVSPAVKTEMDKVRYWKDQVEGAKKREERWRDDACAVIKLYEAEKKAENSFNILYSNTETLHPAIYSYLPRPVVTRRFKDEDPVGLAASKALKRVLQFLLNQPDSEYTSYDELFQQACLSALLPGRAVTRFKYDADFAPMPDAAGEEVGESPGQLPLDYEGQEADDDKELDDKDGVSQPVESNEVLDEAEPGKQVTYETICGVAHTYDEVYFGHAKRWKDVPFVAFEYAMTRADVTDNFGAGIAKEVAFKKPEGEEDERVEGEDGEKTCVVWEIWHKAKRQVVFVSPDYDKGYLKDPVDDPLKLGGFYPIPRPLSFTLKEGNLTPTPLYKFYEEQARELNRVTSRINKIISALKVRGFYDGTLKELDKLMEQEDNTLLAAESAVALTQNGSLDKFIWLMPLDKLITVLQQLYMQRQQCKQVIYEITGISDIQRGASVASETATAQQIKNQWGTLRLKRAQRAMSMYIRDCLGIMGEIACQQFSEETFAKMTGLQHPTGEEKAKAQQMVATLQAAVSSLQQMAQMQQGQPGVSQGGPPMPGQPPAPPQQPPQPPPQLAMLQQQLQQAQQTAQAISWTDILGVLRDDLQRNFRIDIETNSTVDIDATEDQKQITDIMTAISQMFQSIGPVVQQGIMSPAVLKAMMLVVVRRFQFGDELEDSLMQMSDKLPPPPPDPKAAALQQQAQNDAQEHQLKMQEMQASMANDQQKADLEKQMGMMKLQMEAKQMELDQQAMEMKLMEGQQKLAMTREQMNMKRQEGQIGLATKAAESQQQLAFSEQTHAQSMEHSDMMAKQKVKQAAMMPAKPKVKK